MPTCNRLHLETLGSRPTMPINPPWHCIRTPKGAVLKEDSMHVITLQIHLSLKDSCMNHMVTRFKCTVWMVTHNYIWSQTPRMPPGTAKAHTMSEWQKCTDWEATVALYHSLHAVCSSCPKLPRGRLYSQIASHLAPYVAQWEWWLHRPQGIRYHVADGHWPILKMLAPWILGYI